MIEKETILQTCNELLCETTIFLMRLVQFESISSYEGPAMEWVYEQFKDISPMNTKRFPFQRRL